MKTMSSILLTSPDRGSRRGVGRCLASICVNHDSRVVLGRIAGNGGEEVAAGRAGPAASDLDLRALGVELGSVGLVESEEFVADEVVACSKRAGDGGLPVQVLEDVVGSPGSAGEGRSGHSLLVNLSKVSLATFRTAVTEP
jgi:hypothetical protein